MFWFLLLAFTVLPALELYLLIQVGTVIGPLNTVLIILVTGLVGAALAKREGLSVVRQLTDELKQGLPGASRLAEGALVLAGGLLLVTPGMITDVSGFLFILPWTRRLLAPILVRFLASRFQLTHVKLGRGVDTSDVPPVQGASDARPGRSSEAPFDHPVS